MNECVINQHLINPSMLILLGALVGTAAGLLLALVLIMSLRWLEAGRARARQHTEVIWQKKEALARAQGEEALLDDIDKALASLTCFLCWEEKHPGQEWPEPWGVCLCGTHYVRAMLQKANV